MIRAVIFDMDGVLIDAKDWHYEALNRALEPFGYTIPRHEHETTYDGLPTKRKLEMLAERFGLPAALHGFINEMKQVHTLQMARELCRPNPTHLVALRRLKLTGYRLAVASNSVRQSVTQMMELAGLTPYLDLQLSNEDVAKAKPHPDIYTKAIQTFGLSPTECLVVEDNENGIRAAEAAGAHLLVVRDVHEVHVDNILTRIDAVQAVTRRAA